MRRQVVTYVHVSSLEKCYILFALGYLINRQEACFSWPPPHKLNQQLKKMFSFLFRPRLLVEDTISKVVPSILTDSFLMIRYKIETAQGEVS